MIDTFYNFLLLPLLLTMNLILGEICLVFEFSYSFTLAFGHSFSKFIYSLSFHKFT